jgi:predicted ATP-dependent serine protease
MGGGLYKGFTYGLCGKEKAGKTTLAHTISSQLQCKHAYIAMEMGSEQIEQKNLARQIGQNSLAFLQKPETLKNKIETAKPNENIYYYDAIGATLDKILQVVSVGILKHGLQGFIVDYWQLIQPDGRTPTEEKHLRDVAQSLANFARKNNVWCVVLAQLNKDGGLFGGNGLRKACDQLYMIEHCTHQERGRWIRQDASRYTIKADIGDEENPAIYLDISKGPYFYDIETG